MVQTITFALPARPYGFHLVTNEVLARLPGLPETGLLHLFIQHTSAGLCISENADPDVRHDFRLFFDRLAPERLEGIRHTLEGPDDMPAHVKAALVGASVSIPIAGHGLFLGIWQGIYLCEFRKAGGPRQIAATILGDGAFGET